MAFRGELRVRSGAKQRWTSCRAILVKPDAKHEVVAQAAPVLIAFVESESELGAAPGSGKLRAHARHRRIWFSELGKGSQTGPRIFCIGMSFPHAIR
jgi:hypothetical protein